VTWALVYNAGLIFETCPIFTAGEGGGQKVKVLPWQVGSTLKSFFTSLTHGTIFNRIRQMAKTAQERATITLTRTPTVLTVHESNG